MKGLKRTTTLFLVIFCSVFSIQFASADNEYLVEKGDSLSKIGQLLGVPWQEIMKANNLKNTVIHPKQILIIPSAGKVYQNETPAKSHELVVDPPPKTFEPEVVLGPAPIPAEPNQYDAAPRTPVEHNPVPQRYFSGSYSDAKVLPPIQGNTLSRYGSQPIVDTAPTPEKVTYMVKNGDTIWSISRNFGLTLRELQKANDMNTSKIYPGQVLSIPKKVVVAAN